MFEVYTYFGRVLATFPIGVDELHHSALQRATKFMNLYPGTCWIRLKK